MTRIEVRDDADGTRAIMIEAEDFSPETELAPWLAAFERVVQASGRLLTAMDPASGPDESVGWTLMAPARIIYVCPKCGTDLESVKGFKDDISTVQCRECGTWSKRGAPD